MPLGAATVSNDLVFTTLYTGVLIALNRTTGAIVYQHTAANLGQRADRHRRQHDPRPRRRPQPLRAKGRLPTAGGLHGLLRLARIGE